MGNFVFPTMNIKQGTSAAPYYNSLRINQRLDNRISDFTRKLGLFDELLQSYLDGNTSNVNFDIQDERLVSQNQAVAVYNLQEFLNSDMFLDSDNFFGLSETQIPSKMSLDFRKFLVNNSVKSSGNITADMKKMTPELREKTAKHLDKLWIDHGFTVGMNNKFFTEIDDGFLFKESPEKYFDFNKKY